MHGLLGIQTTYIIISQKLTFNSAWSWQSYIVLLSYSNVSCFRVMSLHTIYKHVKKKFFCCRLQAAGTYAYQVQLFVYEIIHTQYVNFKSYWQSLIMYVFWSELLSSAAEAIRQAHCRRSLNPYTLYVIFLFILQSRYVAVLHNYVQRVTILQPAFNFRYYFYRDTYEETEMKSSTSRDSTYSCKSYQRSSSRDIEFYRNPQRQPSSPNSFHLQERNSISHSLPRQQQLCATVSVVDYENQAPNPQ